jgi:ATP-dependent RNA helicase SUPV3L1/SUV3
MPLERPVAVVAVDEIQLMAHRTRGHVFTDRVLRARGIVETMLLGAGTAAPLVETLVPTARIVRQPRLSRLSHAGHHKLGKVPPRSAVVVFSASEVYATAEKLRAKHGGVAVVLGALSPRTRNAQVELYQSGEVPILVATDAIGMGLNLDLDHVAFAATRKYDGRAARALHDEEVAQIAGRAGRYMRDGTFGTTGEADPLPIEVTDAVEQHLFTPLVRAWWRSADLDLSSVDRLLASLAVLPRKGALSRMPDADDEMALAALASRREVRGRARGEQRVATLWEVAQIPDYRKTLPGAHVELLAEVYAELTERGALASGWIEPRLAHLDRTEGEIDALMTRLAYVRTWNYVAFREGWVEGAQGVRDRTRAIEDRLSDVLHERLIQRFVEHRVVVGGGSAARPAVVAQGDTLRAGEGVVGQLVGLRVVEEGRAQRPPAAVVLAARPVLEARARELALAPDAAFLVGEPGEVTAFGGPIARFKPGSDPSRPRWSMLDAPDVSPAARAEVGARVGRFVEGWLRGLFETCSGPGTRSLSPPAVALIEQVRRGLGVVLTDDVAELLERLDGPDRQALARLDVRFGRYAVYMHSWLRPSVRRDLRVLASVWYGHALDVPWDRPAVEARSGSEEMWRAFGYIRSGKLAIRPDILERVAACAREAGRRGPYRLPNDIPAWLAVGPDLAVSALTGLGERTVEVGGEIRLIPLHLGGRR